MRSFRLILECDTGYEFIGSRCEPCNSGHYGLKCTDTCSCKAYESKSRKRYQEKEKVQQGGSKHSKKEKINSSINPYQLVVSSAVDVHQYSSTEKGDNAENNNSDSGYLHPYQPLSLDTKNLKHDYTECKDLDIVESKATIDIKGLKHDYTEWENFHSIEAPASNTKEDDVDK
ncbi:MEGF10_11 [Mytilus edulis]|uniref:MEGF10_11 n=1 Tax=Mytilus edulis TaxID=6550 RepID=A0A8S3TIP5_MYTED|nr:MEGF10_11 [Mytilus edulis]